jgi:hypothetical protein
MQDRPSANSMKVLLQRTAGPYIRVRCVTSARSRRARNVRYVPKADEETIVSVRGQWAPPPYWPFASLAWVSVMSRLA